MAKQPNAYIIARNTESGQVEYWNGQDWSYTKAEGKTFKTLQAVDRAATKITSERMLYITE